MTVPKYTLDSQGIERYHSVLIFALDTDLISNNFCKFSNTEMFWIF
jgi:hypothetical protein